MLPQKAQEVRFGRRAEVRVYPMPCQQALLALGLRDPRSDLSR